MSMPAPYYQDDSCTIYHGDCREILPGLTGIDLVVTSPPYNLVGRSGLGHYKAGGGLWNKAQRKGGLSEGYADYGDNMPEAEYVQWQQAVLNCCWDTLSDTGAIFYNHKPRVVGTDLWTPLALNPGLPVRQIVVWDRNHGINFSPTYYMPMSEWIVVLAKPDFRLRNQAASGVGDVWRIEPEIKSEHPAPFPIGLPARAIETCAPTSVLDPFMGSGTTLRAAKNAGVRAIGIEISERYCEMAAKRLAQEVLPLEMSA